MTVRLIIGIIAIVYSLVMLFMLTCVVDLTRIEKIKQPFRVSP